VCYSLWYNAPTMLPVGEIYLLIKYIKSFLWRVAKRLSYIEDERCLKVKRSGGFITGKIQYPNFKIEEILAFACCMRGTA